MTIDTLTLGDIKSLKSFFTSDNANANTNTNTDTNHPYKIGLKYLIRTVTMTQVGKLIAIYQNELVLQNASWVADTGKFNYALTTGDLDEVEPFNGNVIVGRGAIIDCVEWNYALPTVAK